MRNLFPGYYQPTEQEFTALWEECIFSFDTNVLLHIYRYTPKTRNIFFDILDQLKERIWIPHHVAFEYQKERFSVISHQLRAYDEIQKTLDKSLQALKGDLGVYNRHSLIDTNQIIEIFERAIKKVKRNLSKAKQEHPDFIISDELRDKITEILDGKVGKPYSKDKLKEIYKDSEQRFKESIPPGYKDNKKPEPDKYGDVVLWFQLIDYAKSEKKPLIFITDDMKEDWWLEHEGKIISPRPELIQEVSFEAGVQFYMYSTDRFMDYAESFLKLPEQEEAIEEAREIRLLDAADYLENKQLRHFSSDLLAGIERSTLPMSKLLAGIERSTLPMSKLLAGIERSTLPISKLLADIERSTLPISKLLPDIESQEEEDKSNDNDTNPPEVSDNGND